MSRMASDVLEVPRAGFEIVDPWTVPPVCQPVRLRRATDGQAPRLSTTVAAYHDPSHITFVFCATDDVELVATHRSHDAPLYEEDVVEVFLAPANTVEYFEFEVSPRGATFDARIESPDGVRATMKADVGWNCRDLFAAVRRSHESSGEIIVDTVIRIPFASIGAGAPRDGDVWRGNLFRIDRRHGQGEFSAWQPTYRDPADFHVVSAFGRLRFQNGDTRVKAFTQREFM